MSKTYFEGYKELKNYVRWWRNLTRKYHKKGLEYKLEELEKWHLRYEELQRSYIEELKKERDELKQELQSANEK